VLELIHNQSGAGSQILADLNATGPSISSPLVCGAFAFSENQAKAPSGSDASSSAVFGLTFSTSAR
jgi:hypothetical protein